MHISDMLSQYNRNMVQSSTEELKGVSGLQKLVSTLAQLQKGNIFEGTVQAVRGNKVTLALSDGQLVTAMLDGKLSLQVGSPMFFQVKSNEGNTVTIRPYKVDGNAGNPILLNALTTAGIQVNERNLSMIDVMMRMQMPIDKSSVINMAKVANMNPEVSIKTVVEMVKLGIPVSNEMASQFENYVNDEHAILKEMNQIMEQVAVQIGSEEMKPEAALKLQQQVLDIFAGNSESVQMPNTPLNQILSEEQLVNLNKLLQNVPTLAENSQLFSMAEEEVFVDTMQEDQSKFAAQAEASVNEGTTAKAMLDEHMTAPQFLKAVQQGLLLNKELGFSGMQKLFASKEYQEIFRDFMEEQWLLRPEQLKSGQKVNELYERLERQIRQMEQAIETAGIKNKTFTEASIDVRNNIEFMNQVNQMYTYVQLPLKLQGQNANSELFVYTNKKKLSDPDAEVTAFLHLDLEHLGSTDVSVKLLHKNVNTNFYFEDDESYSLVKMFLPRLEKRIMEKGYTCTFSVHNEEKTVSFVDDFLRKDQPQAGTLHRYSFDVKT